MVESSGTLRDADLRAGAVRQYAKMNTLAMVSFIFGVLGCLLVPIPVAIILGVVAIRRIRASKGAEVGVPLAVAGMVVALGMGVAVGAFFLRREQTRKQGIQASRDAVFNFFHSLSAGRPDDAFALLSESAKQMYNPEVLKSVAQQTASGGRVLDVMVEVTDWQRAGRLGEAAKSRYILKTERANWVFLITTSKYGDSWKIDQIEPRGRWEGPQPSGAPPPAGDGHGH